MTLVTTPGDVAAGKKEGFAEVELFILRRLKSLGIVSPRRIAHSGASPVIKKCRSKKKVDVASPKHLAWEPLDEYFEPPLAGWTGNEDEIPELPAVLFTSDAPLPSSFSQPWKSMEEKVIPRLLTFDVCEPRSAVRFRFSRTSNAST